MQDEDFHMVVDLYLSYIRYLARGHIRCGDMAAHLFFWSGTYIGDMVRG